MDDKNILCFTADENDAGTRLDVLLALHGDITRSAAAKLCDEYYVSVNGEAQVKKYTVKAGDIVEALLPEPEPTEALPEDIPLNVVYEDNDVIVVNKPKGMVVHPAAGNLNGTLVNALLYHCKGSLSGINGVIRPGIVHRIDKNTSGLLVCAKNDKAHIGLAEQIKEHSVDRTYEALLVGNLRDDRGTVDAPIGRHPLDRKRMAVISNGREAVTHYEVLERFKGFCHVRLNLETGRTHQIRVHMKSLGHPVMGDSLYGANNTPFEKKHEVLICEQCLHAKTLGFIHPITGEKLIFDSLLPEYFTKLIELLRGLQ